MKRALMTFLIVVMLLVSAIPFQGRPPDQYPAPFPPYGPPMPYPPGDPFHPGP